MRPGSPKLLALVPVPLLLVAIIAARMAGLRECYENEALRLVLSFTFYTLVSLGTIFLIGRSFLTSGSPGLLLLECGVILWSLAGAAGDVFDHGDANINVTIFNTTILLAGLCHLAGALLLLRPQRSLRAKPLWLGAGCALALGALWLVTWAALAHGLPVFFVPGQGGTMVRYCVLISGTAMFVLSAILLRAGQRGVCMPFISWYSLALLLLAVGLFGIMIQLSLWSVVNWLGRTAQWLGGFYLLIAAIAAMRESNLPLLPLGEKARPALYRDAMAVAIVLAATAVRLVFLPALGTGVAFLTFYPAVMFAALYGGRRAGLLAAVLSALLADYFWIEPVGQFSLAHPRDWISLSVFLASCTMISFVCEAMHRSHARAIAAEEQAKHALERETTADFLRMVNESRNKEELVRAAASFFQEKSGCEAVGIRVKDGDDYPYCEVRGFSREFVRLEDQLCTRDSAGAVIRDNSGYPICECMCGNVIGGRFDLSKPYFTARGSFWTNSTTELLANTTEADRQARTRNRCNGEGYESVALIALIAGKDRLGLLQLNDRRTGRFTLEGIALWERLAGYLAVALAKTLVEERLHDSEQQFRTLADSIPNLAWWANGDGYITWYNRRWYEYTGTTPEQMEGWGWQSVHDPQELPSVLDRWKASIATGEPFDMTFPLRGADGVFRPFLTRIMPLKDEEGRVTRWFGTNTDVSTQMRVERSLGRLAAIVESSDDAILSMDLNGIIQTWNGGAERLFGYRSEEVIGQRVTLLFPSERIQEEEQIIGRVRIGQPVKHLETVRVAKDGRRLDVS